MASGVRGNPVFVYELIVPEAAEKTASNLIQSISQTANVQPEIYALDIPAKTPFTAEQLSTRAMKVKAKFPDQLVNYTLVSDNSETLLHLWKHFSEHANELPFGFALQCRHYSVGESAIRSPATIDENQEIQGTCAPELTEVKAPHSPACSFASTTMSADSPSPPSDITRHRSPSYLLPGMPGAWTIPSRASQNSSSGCSIQ